MSVAVRRPLRATAALLAMTLALIGLPSAAEGAVTRAIVGEVAGGDVDAGWAELYTWQGDYLATAPIEDGEYRFDGVPAGAYKVLIEGVPGRSRQWARYSESSILGLGEVAFPGRIAVTSSSPSTVRAWDVELDTSTPLMVPVKGKARWTSEVVCVAAYRYPFRDVDGDVVETRYPESEAWPDSVDCTRPGGLAVLDEVVAGKRYALRIVPRDLRTVAAWTGYEGDDYWYGNYDDALRNSAVAPPGTLVLGTFDIPPTLIRVAEAVGGDWYEAAHFTDVGGASKAFVEISWLSGQSIASGYADGTFRPRESVTRGNLAKLLYRYAGRPDVDLPAKSPFTDVKPSDGGYRAMVWLYRSGVASGFPDGSFRPDEEVSRRNLAKLLYRFAGRPDFAVPARSPYKDLTTRSGGYRAMAWMDVTGIASGFSDGTFRPEQDVIRRQLATFLYRFTFA
ncbi:S-layer homology domain-containing protein [Demequina iriomotensis]|uniref:S-layer homology domain-containing protein n=1 Tax=Demequina iriomotensis TaxID=1536641 RepID=UPI000780FCA2|nr:S-layer homology domain-containing protein [Demequina iriomotensis]